MVFARTKPGLFRVGFTTLFTHMDIYGDHIVIQLVLELCHMLSPFPMVTIASQLDWVWWLVAVGCSSQWDVLYMAGSTMVIV